MLLLCGLLLAVLLSACGGDQPDRNAADAVTRTATASALADSTQTPGPGLQTGLPGRASATPAKSTATPFTLPNALITPLATLPLMVPTSLPAQSPTPMLNCTQVFPIERIEAIRFGTTTSVQLEAAFGSPASVSGRSPTYRFETRGCVLAVGTGSAIAQEASLFGYGTLGWLLDRYGPPAAVGISEGSLASFAQGSMMDLVPGYAVLLYPDEGIIAIFSALPDEVARTTPIGTLQFRAPFTVTQQENRLKLLLVDDWVPPLR
jgi:hypothetical protein